MKVLKTISIILCIIAFSCNESKEEKKNNIIKREAKPELIVDFNFKTNVKDEFKLILLNIKMDEFQTKNIQIKETIPTSSGFERIYTKYGENNMSGEFLFMLGKKEKDIFIKDITFKFGDNQVIINKDNFLKFIRFNKFVSFDKSSFTITTQKMDGNHIPTLYAKKSLIDSIFKNN